MSHNITVDGGSSVRLPTAGKYCDRDIVVTALGGAEDLDAELTEQESLIEQLGTILDNIVIPEEPVIEPLEVTENGTYTAPDGVDGYSPVVVNVPTGGGGGGGASVIKKDVNFYDYDGTLLHSYTVAEAQALTELPALPEQSGLVCQGWNWSLEDIKAHNRAVDVGAMYITDDGTTRIYITLQEGRTSPILGVCPNGTVTVDWGDGTAPDVLTGTSAYTVKYTPNHQYAKPGKYVIRLTVDGEIGFYGNTNAYSCVLRQSSSSDNRSYAYRGAIQKIQIGNGVKQISNYAFYGCSCLTDVTIPNNVTNIGEYAFNNCYSLTSVSVPNSVTSIGSRSFCNFSLVSVSIPNSVTRIADYAFYTCYSLTSLTIPDGVTSIGSTAFSLCYGLTSFDVPNGVTTVNTSMLQTCYSLTSLTIPDGVTSIGNNAFSGCVSLATVTLPDSVTSIGNSAFYNCHTLSSVVIPASVNSIGTSAFNYCYSARVYDFSSHTAVPTLANSNAFSSIPTDCEIRVPAALYDEWIAATNWSTHASKIVAV